MQLEIGPNLTTALVGLFTAAVAVVALVFVFNPRRRGSSGDDDE